VAANGTNWLAASGNARYTTNGYVTHFPSNSVSFPVGGMAVVPSFTILAAKAQANPVVWLYLTNGVNYRVQITQPMELPSTTVLITNATYGWTNFSMRLTNASGISAGGWLWVVCNSWTNPVPAGTGQIGYSRVVYPTEYQTRVVSP
jgi:hypothetical protein